MSQFIEMFGDSPTKELRDVCIQSGEYGSNTPADTYDGNTRYVRITDINDYGKLNKELVSPRVIEEKYLLTKNDLLFARTGNTVGKTYLHEHGRMIYAGYLIRYRLNKEIMLPEFAFAFTHTSIYYDWVERTKKVGAQPNISAAQYDKMPILVPSMGQQRAFVAVAEQADKSKFGDFKSQFIEMTTRSELNKKSIGEIAEVRTGSTPSRSNPEYWNGTHYWVSAQDMGNKYIYDTLEKITDKGYATCKVVPAGSILYVCRGSIGVMSINTMDCATNQSICTATCKKGYNTEYLYYALKVAEKTIKKQGIGTSFKSLNQSAFSSIEILFPAIEIQDKFAAIAKQADKSKSYVLIAFKNLESMLRYCIGQIA